MDKAILFGRWLLGRGNGETSKSKLFIVATALIAVLANHGIDVDPAYLKDLGIIGGVLALIGFRNAPGIAGNGS